MIELIGAMIIIAVLTVAGITAVSTAINNSRITAVNEDIEGFRKVSEQFMMENPEYSKWNGQNTPDALVEAYELYNDRYLEGEMKIDPATIQKTGIVYLRGFTQRKDPWGNPYMVMLSNRKLDVDGTNSNSFFQIILRSNGKNGNNLTGVGSWHTSQDDDDYVCVSQFSGGQTASKTFISKDLHSYAYLGYNPHANVWKPMPLCSIPGMINF